jgi:hypothetical protein
VRVVGVCCWFVCARELLRLLLLCVVAAAAVRKYFHRDFTFVFVCIFLRNRLRPSFNDDVDVDTRCIS